MNKALVYGKDSTERIVSVEVKDGTVEIFTEDSTGKINVQVVPHKYWLLYANKMSSKFQELTGEQHYSYLMEYDDYERYRQQVQNSYQKRYDFYTAHDPKSNFMLKSGVTYFKGLNPEDVSVLSTDLETTGLTHDKNSKVLLISNTFRKKGKITRKLFSVDEYGNDDKKMIAAWCKWVNEVNPSIVIGHRIMLYDIPYLLYRSDKLKIGRDGSAVTVSERSREFRKDGSQSYEYNDVHIYGREIIDTFFLSIKYDSQRKYSNYKLKDIIAHEKLEKKGRQFYDAATIKDNWHIPEERQKIKAYAMDDADDALALYDLMIPAYFYYAQHIPRAFQQINNTATGSQINDLMIRAYLQDGGGIPKASEKVEFEGAISFGTPGIHKNVFKIDVTGMYPGIMLQFRISPGKDKDPNDYFLQILEHFSSERIVQKTLFKKTKIRLHEDKSNSGKIVVNSGYGFMGAKGLHFNNPEGAAEVTRKGREILQSAIYWATGKEYSGISESSENEELQTA